MTLDQRSRVSRIRVGRAERIDERREGRAAEVGDDVAGACADGGDELDEAAAHGGRHQRTAGCRSEKGGVDLHLRRCRRVRFRGGAPRPASAAAAA